MREILTLDNLWHSLVAIFFTAVWCAVALLAHFWFDAWGWIGAVLAGTGLYLREASQVDWDWTLRWSWHKHAEWLVGTVAGALTALVFALVT